MTVRSEPSAPPERVWRIEPRTALVLSTVCWAGFAAVAWLIHTGAAASADRAGLLMWRGADLRPLGPAWLHEGVRDLTGLGGVFLRNLLSLAAAVALLFLRLRREAVVLVLTVASGWLVDEAIKVTASRPRPQIVPHLTEAGGASFPSGHSFNSALIYITIALAFAAISRRGSVRAAVIAAAAALTLAIGWSRIWLGVHWPSDVLAGWLGGAGWAFLAAAVGDCRGSRPRG